MLSIVRGVDPIAGEQVIPPEDSGWWIPLTVSEKAKIDAAQDRSWKWRKPVRALLENDTAVGFGGYWLEGTTGQVTISAVNVEYARQKLATLPGALDEIVVVPAKHTEKQLYEALDKAGQSIAGPKGPIIRAHINIIGNSLVIGVSTENRAAYPAIVLEIASQITTEFKVMTPGQIPEPLGTDQNVAPPIKGGTILKIAGAGTCTLGFVGYRNNGMHALTAGHCGLGNYYQGPTTSDFYLGYVTDANRCFNEQTCGWDFTWVPLWPGDAASRLIHESTTAKRSITSWQLRNEDEKTDRVCMSGQRRNYPVCGTLINKAVHVDYLTTPIFDGWKSYYLREATFVGWKGDSGGPVYGENTWRAAGLLVAGCEAGCNGLYHHIHDVLWYSGVTALYTAS